MKRIIICVFLLSFLLLLNSTRSEGEEVKRALLSFLVKLTAGNAVSDPNLGWNSTSDPCQWKGVFCDSRTIEVRRIILHGLNFSGTFDPSILCSVQSLAKSLNVISLNDNSLHEESLDEIASCKHLTLLYLRGNRFSGILPDSLSRLNDLKRLDISNNSFSGTVPDLARISGLTEFLAQNNQLSGPIPNFDFANFQSFNVSSNNFSGRIPDGGYRFPTSSYLGNPELCGVPLPNKCPSA